MATESPMSENLALLQALMGIPQMLTGKSAKQVTSGGTTTQQTQLSPEAMSALMKSAMEQTGGLASIAGAQKMPGMYNSTSRTLMVNDLLARSAAEIAKVGAPTITTRPITTVQTIAPNSNRNATLLGLVGSAAMSEKGKKLLGRGVDWLEQTVNAPDFSYMPQSTMSDAEVFGSGSSYSPITDVYDLPFDTSSFVGSGLLEAVSNFIGEDTSAAMEMYNALNSDEDYLSELTDAAASFGWD